MYSYFKRWVDASTKFCILTVHILSATISVIIITSKLIIQRITYFVATKFQSALWSWTIFTIFRFSVCACATKNSTLLKFIYSEKVTKILRNLHLFLTRTQGLFWFLPNSNLATEMQANLWIDSRVLGISLIAYGKIEWCYVTIKRTSLKYKPF